MPIYTKTEFYQVTGYDNVFEIPVDENIISVYISNNAGYLGLISINGTNKDNGLTLISGKNLFIKGLTDQILTGKISVKLLTTGDIQQVGILIKRRVNEFTKI